MKIFQYEIKIITSWRGEYLLFTFLFLIPLIFCNAMLKSDYFALYRLGDVIFPKESQLIRSGPFVMKEGRKKNQYFVKFISLSGKELYSENTNNFNNRNLNFQDYIESGSLAYLWISKSSNISRNVWKIEINDKEIFSYNRAIFIYRVESDPGFDLDIAIFSFFGFLFSFLNVDKIPRKT